MKKLLWWGIGAVLVILVLGLGGWWAWGKVQGPLQVKAGAVAPISMQEDVYATGSVVPVFRQEVVALNPGRVAKVAVQVGDSVKVGQTLVSLDTTLEDAQVAQARANVEAAQTNVDAALPSLLAQSKAALKQAQEALKVAQVQQGLQIYKATLAGTVLEVNAQEGNTSPVQQPLVIVANLAQMNVEAQLNEVDAGKVKLGQKVTVTSKVLGNTSVQGTIAEIAPEAVSQLSAQGNVSPTVSVTIRLDQVPAGLKPGFTVSIQIIAATKAGVLAVPQEALFQEGSKNYVYQIKERRLLKTEVKVGIGNDTHQEITSGLKAGDLVVLNPSNDLEPGQRVTPDTESGGT
ncbi:efflux RND transporter periplasmic adaptor subunit [Desulfosporosinus sp. OT]|uniref:efflux RND transporter periplasmic adaptor subunit n=1 Tax=Desulfosporosinus sp. OT TaxID=913865 RepID=UPI00031B1CB5|nr:efflux RND transporter periplasmic adaptor subunit [Desulfosporosinus sp. OT]